MAVFSNGRNKVIEELSELIQVASKLIESCNKVEILSGNLEEEIADVQASCRLIIQTHSLDAEKIEQRTQFKLDLYLDIHSKGTKK
jgi:NTP pyrophosphatase (non-canonical NTP hydrolase)